MGDSIAIIGSGPLGLMMVRLSKCLGASKVYITGLKIDSQRLLVAKELGADEVIIADEKDPIFEHHICAVHGDYLYELNLTCDLLNLREILI